MFSWIPRVMLAAALAGLAGAVHVQVAAQQPLPSDPQRLDEMRHHFLQVTQIYEAIIRGDLAAVRQPATELAALPTPAGIPDRAIPFVEAVRAAGRRAMIATTLEEAASPLAMMLSQCGQCHRTVGIFPGPSIRNYPDVGGIVGHMLAHQRAVDELLQGLLIPSESRWFQGAERLRTAELARSDLPSDLRTSELRGAETAVHALADRAAEATSLADRVAVYSELSTKCAACHGLHAQIWGPRSR